MRIIAGEFRGRRLAALGKGDAGAHLRPTTDRVRESLFSILAGGRFGDPLEDAVVLDLFAGTGALGLEALSRGARQATFVDDGRVAQKLLAENIRELAVKDRATVLRVNATRLPPCGGTAATLVFLDPPYGKGLGEPALEAALAQGWIADEALIVWEESAEVTVPEGWALLDRRKFGDSSMSFVAKG